jgi:hypothetical protein
MEKVRKWFRGILSRVESQIVHDLAKVAGFLFAVTGVMEEKHTESGSGEKKKQEAYDAMLEEFKKPGGIDLPGWLMSPMAKDLVFDLIELVVSMAQGKDTETPKYLERAGLLGRRQCCFSEVRNHLKPVIENMAVNNGPVPGNKWLNQAQNEFIRTKARNNSTKNVDKLLDKIGLGHSHVEDKIKSLAKDHDWFI